MINGLYNDGYGIQYNDEHEFWYHSETVADAIIYHTTERYAFKYLTVLFYGLILAVGFVLFYKIAFDNKGFDYLNQFMKR